MAWNWGSAGSGAVSGASTGAVFGPWGAAIGGVAGGLLGGLEGGDKWKNPADAANPYLNQIPDTLKQYYNPYINAGQQAMGTTMGQYNNLINDPTAMMNKIGAGYQKSPGFDWQVGQATNAANNAAAASGMAGSPAEQQELATTVNGLANQDYGQYMDSALGQYRMGLQGMGGINQMGFNASSNLANGLSTNLMNQANLAYAGQQSDNERSAGSGFGSFLDAMPGISSFFKKK